MGNSLFLPVAVEPPDVGALAVTAASTLDVPVAMVLAVWDLESGARWTNDAGEPLHRFEPATFDRGAGSFRRFLSWGPGRLRRAFVQAVQDDPERAFRSASWSVGQVMGMHHAFLGHDTARGMVTAWARDPAAAVSDWCLFIKRNGLDVALRNQDLRAFARGYNGAGNVDAYSAKLAKALRRVGAPNVPEVISFGARGAAVKVLQRKLGATVDGFFGPQTREALIAYQVANGLRPDGIAGPKVWGSLQKRDPARVPQQDDANTGPAAVGAVEASGVIALSGTAGGVVNSLDGLARQILGGALAAVVVGLLVVAAVLWWRGRKS